MNSQERSALCAEMMELAGVLETHAIRLRELAGFAVSLPVTGSQYPAGHAFHGIGPVVLTRLCRIAAVMLPDEPVAANMVMTLLKREGQTEDSYSEVATAMHYYGRKKTNAIFRKVQGTRNYTVSAEMREMLLRHAEEIGL